MTDASRANQGEPTNPLDRLANKLQDVNTADAELDELELKPFVGDDSSVPIGLKRLGDFELVERIGAGGMGAVYRARQRSLDKLVAVKVIRPDFAFDVSRVARFRGEALAASKVQHSGIVSVHFVGEQDGVHYIAEELIEGGRTLADLIRERRDAPPKDHHRSMAELFAKIADALEAVHQAKVIHRDIKPGNILLTPQGEPKVADFGLAKDLDGVNLLTSGETPGTLAYKSPEHLDKRIGSVDARSDLFSLGVSLYEALTFTRPFVGNEVEVAARILHREVEDLRATYSGVPAELSVICRKAMEKEPHRRYQSMAEFASDLRRFLNNEPILAQPPSATRRAQLWVRRNKVASVLIVAAILVAGTSTASVLAISATNAELESQKTRAESNATLARQQEQVAIKNLNDVLALSAQKDHDDLVAEAEKLWPAHPEMIPAYEDWLRRANELIDGRPEDEAKGLKKRPSLAEHKAKLAELRAAAKPLSEDQIRADRESHSKYAELQAKQAELLWRSRMLGDEAWPSEAEVGAELANELLSTDADALNELAWPLVDPAKPLYGQEVRALLLARRALAAASEEKRSGIRDTLAWALFKAGRSDEALDEERKALSEPGGDALKSSAANLKNAVGLWRGDELAKRRETRDKLAEEVTAFTAQVNERRTYEFDDPEKEWWNRQLVKLVSDLEALRDPQTGLMNDVLAEPFGWGVAKRYAFAKSIGDRSVSGADAKRLWSEAIAAIKSSSKYGGLEIVPQMGLLPIGMDLDSQLWEFAHLQSGDPAISGADGRPAITAKMGVVLVLIPGGTFYMGAQKNKQAGQNYDTYARENESPVHQVELGAFFLSKYEMTRAQWMAVGAGDPSGHEVGRLPLTDIHPIDSVSWDMCCETMRRFGLTLPSEAQWEYACRSGSSSAWWMGSGREEVNCRINIADQAFVASGGPAEHAEEWPDFEDGWSIQAPIGSFEPNAFGLHEVHGNMAEWCIDVFDFSFYSRSPTTDPVCYHGQPPYRVSRGGCFRWPVLRSRSAYRSGNSTDNRSSGYGVRPAKAVTPRTSE